MRLFTELKEKNRALTEALEQQTATSEILRTIAHVQTDAQPVFDTIVRSAARLCHATVTGLFLTDGQMVYLPANHGSSPETLAVNRARFPRPLDMDTPPGVTMLTRSLVHVDDTEQPSAMEYVRHVGRLLGFRSAVTVPMLREGEAVGAISVTRRKRPERRRPLALAGVVKTAIRGRPEHRRLLDPLSDACRRFDGSVGSQNAL